MLIVRYRATIKRGRMLDAIALIKQMAATTNQANISVSRITTGAIGDNDVLSWDVVCKDMAAVSDFYADLMNPETAEARYKGLSEWMEMTKAVENELLMVLD